jgi:hypothetical protein
MSKTAIVLSVLLGSVVVAGGMGFMTYIEYSNSEVKLRAQAKAQQKNLENVFDNTWKIISQQAQVAESYKDAFAKIYPDIMQGRYGNARGGSLLSFVTEANPTFEVKLYDRLQVSIEAQRTNFTNEQTKLIDIKREHDVLRTTIPASWFIGSRPELDIVIVTSTKTDNAFKSGKDDDTDIFKPKT